jgi:TonB-linked SusC/RagA family outer membrane protein
MKVSVTQIEKLINEQKRHLKKIFAIVISVLLIFFFAPSTYAQNTIKVSGRITNENGQAVPKASVTVKGKKTGVTGNDNGMFEISVPSNATLIVSSVGYATIEIPVSNRSTISVTLATLSGNMNEVVVVGYGTQRKRDVTGSVISITAAILAETPGANLVNELKGRAAGVDIVSNGATPGSGGSIRIRGNRSMATTSAQSDGLDQPLLVVDGIPFGGSINDINPNDIQSLEILKDASATAIYGSRGSGGVILITTRRGRVGKPQITFSSYSGVSKVMSELRVLNGPEYAQLKADAAKYSRPNPNVNGNPLQASEISALAAGVSTDWQKLIYKNGFTTDNQLSLSGGNETTQYGLGAGYYTETNEIPNQKYERYSLRLTIDHQLNNYIKFGVNNLSTLNISNNPGGGGVPATLLKLSPLALPYNSDGSINLYPQPGIDNLTYVNPLTLKTSSTAILARTRRIRTFNSMYGELSIPWVTGLKYRINVGLDYSQQQNDNYSGIKTFVNSSQSQSQSSATVGGSNAYRWTIENLVTYNKTIRKHRFDLTGLFSSQKDHAQSNSTTALGVPADYIQDMNLGLAGGAITATGSFSEQGLVSYMGRLNYGYDNRYLLTATVRRDGSSVLSPGHQWYTYPAFSLGWNIINEQFANRWSNLFTTLKLRGGWGITSNQGVAPYSTLGLLNATAYNFGQTSAGQQAGYTVGTLANQNLHWESTDQTNIGLDFGILKNRISGSIEVYQQHTKDILMSVVLPISNGANSYTANIGKTSGRGLEITLSTVNVKTASGFTWTTDFNFYFNREKIVALPGSVNDLGNGWFIGQPLTVIYDLKKIGIWQTDDSTKGILAQQTSPVQYPGQIRVQDLNGDGKITSADRQIIGNFQPKWEGGLASRINYKNFDFTFVLFARMGMKVLVPYISTDGGANGSTFFNSSRINQLKVDYWTRNNPTNNFPAPDGSMQQPVFGSTLQYQDGSFIKMRSINLGYTFSDKMLGKTGISSLRIYAAVENPFVIYSPFVRDDFGPDPEGNGYGGAVNTPTYSGNVNGSTNRQVSVNANNPSMRLFNFGLNLRF